MKRVIVPTDFSDTAWNATLHALEYSKIFNSELILLHVFEHSANHLNTNTVEISDSFSKEEVQMRNILRKIDELKAFKHVNIKSKCVSGSLFENLQHLVTNEGRDMVIMGTKGRIGTIQKLFGSNTSRIVKEITCPIMIIPNEFKFSLTTPVTCALDFASIINEDDLKLMKKLVNAEEESIFKIVHVIKDVKDPSKEMPLKQFDGITIKYDEIVGDSVPQLLERYARINNSRLLVIVRKEKGFFENFFNGSVSQEMTVNANVPLLVLRAK